MFKGTPTDLYSQYSVEENVKAVSKQLYLSRQSVISLSL